MSDFDPPTVADVGVLILARTKEEMTRVGTFTERTQPTADQVALLARTARSAVAMRVGEIPERLYPQATAVAAIYAAMLVERSYYPEEIGAGDSLYQELKDDFREGIEALVSSKIDETPGIKGIYSVPLTGDSTPAA